MKISENDFVNDYCKGKVGLGQRRKLPRSPMYDRVFSKARAEHVRGLVFLNWFRLMTSKF